MIVHMSSLNSWHLYCKSCGDIIMGITVILPLGNDATELLVADHTILVFVQLHNSLVNNLLQLCLCQICPHHHLEHLKQFCISDESVSVCVIDAEQKPELFLPVHILGGEHGEPPDKLSEVQLPAVVCVEHRDHSLYQWVLLELGQSEELLDTKGLIAVLVKLPEPLV